MNKQIALVGNPNSGKTSTFNVLTGSNQSIGNWPGVTVERKSGLLKQNKNICIQDLPGIYSLSSYSPEEVVARDYLYTNDASGIINIIDTSNLERNLYLTLQLMEFGLPMILGLNMMDIVKKSGQKLNIDKLSYALGLPAVAMSALKKQGMKELTKACEKMIANPKIGNTITYDDRLEAAFNEIATIIEGKVSKQHLRFVTIKLFERDELVNARLTLTPVEQKEIAEIIEITEKIFDDTAEAIIINERYEAISRITALCLVKHTSFELSFSDKIDRVVTNRFLALPIFAFVMWAVYYLSIQTVGTMGTDWINDVLFGQWVPDLTTKILESWQVAPWMQGLIVDGIIAGVGAVLGFLPQLLVLFFCLAILEDCGYMARIAFVMDRMLRRFGLSGKSFIPILVSTGCGVPGVMATRTIESEKDRRLTIMVTTFMPCSAKLPIIGLVAGAFFPHHSWVAPSAYFVSIISIILSAISLKKTKLFSGEATPFIMELPPYHFPQMKNVFLQMMQRGHSFVKKAGTIIFATSVLIWFTMNFNFRLQMVAANQSILASFGHLLAPLFIPLGWGNWQGAVASMTGLIAKENVINTFGILYKNASEVSETGKEFWQAMHLDFTAVSAYAFLTFNLLCAPCFAAIGAIHREMASVKWTWLAILYQCGFAYVISMMIYQFGHLFFEGGSLNVWTCLSLMAAAYFVYLLIFKSTYQNKLNLAKEMVVHKG
ncbi:ferrous iron transport protein B [Enterococcus cecorum]|uniref:Ferrous iron transport protein B n=1 Tax=Enterococcus cecorum TaxID=44008 RepID=A0AAW9JPR9_9ENTE|nr:ferrous iron transport protein B [Enterococcus cecorum]MBM6935480.1 ferrous iron transport protein B [Enterococcus cecorum]MDZ5504531.1 ferrous iron transport protein B [Enterococcus cecorum]MDZ5531964.1 ferrous iron transport protein B [Enterococcus cecorum]MDZ5544921.1 ferrous iron transport protein B [Enterococcus cecorum]MDZ5549295.1 ferrous iron transport protein B [Enterococcus cecorum]